MKCNNEKVHSDMLATKTIKYSLRTETFAQKTRDFSPFV